MSDDMDDIDSTDLVSLADDENLLLADIKEEDFLQSFQHLVDEDTAWAEPPCGDSIADPFAFGSGVASSSSRRASSANAAAVAAAAAAAADRGSKKRKCNPDADAIAAVTEESMKALNIDMDSKDAKKMRRQIRNRLSAQFHRDRKNAHIKSLEDAVAAKARQVDQLLAEVSELKAENSRLARLLALQSSVSQCGDSSNASMVGTDVESVGTSPAASPYHQPAYLGDGLDTRSPSPTELAMPTTISTKLQLPPLPIPKALGFVAVLCVLAVCCMGNLPAMHTMPTVSSGIGLSDEVQHGRRRLALLDDSAQLLVTPGPVTLSATAGTAGAVASPPLPAENSSLPLHSRQYLRHQPANYSASSLGSPAVGNAVLVRKELIPFDPSGQYWQHSPSPQASSLSHIIMQSGVALFDPSLQMASTVWPPMSMWPLKMAAPSSAVDSDTPRRASQDSAPSSTAVYFSKQLSPRPSDVSTHPSSSSATTTSSVAAAAASTPGAAAAIAQALPESLSNTQRWPAPVPLSLPAPSTGDADSSPPGCSDCSAEKTAFYQSLLSHSNLVTVTLPASAIRMGTSLADSKDGTVEGILRMFNLSETADSSAASHQMQHNPAGAMVELDCILLNAKLLMRDQ